METMKLQVKALINHASVKSQKLRLEGKFDKAKEVEDLGVALLNALDSVNKKD